MNASTFSFRSPTPWIILTIISSALFVGAFYFFPSAFPIISVDIRMNLQEAVHKAKDIARENNCGPDTYHSAATFQTDSMTTMFVELEGGGQQALETMLKEKLYSPYTWYVRHFKEFEKNETLIIFRPDGTPYGFTETLSENMPGKDIDQEEAQQIAERYATDKWNIDFTLYNLVEASKKIEPSGRGDHTLTYELQNKQLGEGHYRMLLRVSGDKVTALNQFVKIPEAFMRRYANMRSANNSIAVLAFLFLIILLSIIVSLFFLVYKPIIIWRQPVIWGIIIALSMVLMYLNNLPMLWMAYNTTTSLHNFLLSQFITCIYSFLTQFLLMTGIFIAAESLTQHAFGNQLQFWRLWTTDCAASYAVLRRTVGGYLLVGFNLAFVVCFYYLTSTFLGWWSPAETLFNPNILSTYAPWFSPVAQAFIAGFSEEAIFRAIPLAGAALIGQRFGKRNLFLGIGLIVQALIFGAAHANYPQQPAYSRIIELFIPAIIWGLMYIRYGLLPSVITHFLYDAVLMSLPLFISYAPYASVHKALAIALMLIPLAVVLYARIKKGFWRETNNNDLNNALATVSTTVTSSGKQYYFEQKDIDNLFIFETNRLPHKRQIVILVLGAAGFLAWLFATPFTHDGIRIENTSSTATQQARDYLTEHNVTLDAPWRALPMIQAANAGDQQHRFIWSEGGKDLYHTMLGTYLEPAHWMVRFAQFNGDIVKCAEEYQIALTNDEILRALHKLPESEAGAHLTQDQARPIAHQAVQERFNRDATTLTEISAHEIKHPNRKDWLFIFSDPNYPLTQGRADIHILISGNTVTDATRAIHVPEEWQRNDINKTQISGNISSMISLLSLLFLFLIFLTQLGRSLHFAIAKKQFIIAAFIALCVYLFNIINAWPAFISSCKTSEPLFTQIIVFLAGKCIGAIAFGVFTAYFIAYLASYSRCAYTFPRTYTTYLLGIAGGAFIAGVSALTQKLVPAAHALWPDYSPLNMLNPTSAVVISTVYGYIVTTFKYSLWFIIINQVLRGSKLHELGAIIMSIILGLTMTPAYPDHTLLSWMLIGTIIGLAWYTLYALLIRFDISMLIIIMATGFVIPSLIQQACFNAYSCATISALLAMVVIIVGTIAWFKKSALACNEKI